MITLNNLNPIAPEAMNELQIQARLEQLLKEEQSAQEILQEVQRQLTQIKTQQRQKHIAAVNALVEQYQLTLPELAGYTALEQSLRSAPKRRSLAQAGPQRTKTTRPPLYQDPDSPATWCGFGAPPKFIKAWKATHDGDYSALLISQPNPSTPVSSGQTDSAA